MDKLQAMRIFVGVAEAESFAGGARKIGVSAPSATRAVNSLEASLGASLLTRTTRQVRLTDVGRTYLEEVQDILAQLQAVEDDVSGAVQRPVGQLRITCPQEFGRIYVAPLITEFLDRHPNVTADVLMVDRIVNLVEEGFDIAVRIGPLPSSGLIAVNAGQVRRVVCGSPGYFARYGVPRSTDDLAAHRIVSSGIAVASREWRFGRDGDHKVRITPQLNVSSIAAAIEIARQGWGLCRVLSYQVGPDLEERALETVLDRDEPEALPIHLVWPDGRRTAGKVRAFVDFASERLRQNSALGRAASKLPRDG